MNNKPHLLYVEDDESLGFVTRDNLELKGYQITHCLDGVSALEAVRSTDFKLCLLDVMLPEMDGFSLAEAIRKLDQHIPIIFLTARSLKEDRIKGLRLGGDDYITKPFSVEELVLKIEVFLSRNRKINHQSQGVRQVGRFEFDYKNLLLKSSENQRNLTQKEADLLRLFIDRKNQVLKRSDILEAVWGEDDYFLGRSLDVFISRLRKYLKEDSSLQVENIHGVGFRFCC